MSQRRRRRRGRLGEWSRTLGIDDAPSRRGERGNVLVVGAVYRGGHTFEGLLSTTVRRDGANATAKLIRMIRPSKFYRQLDAILLDGIALGGFNVVDLDRLYAAVALPVVVVMRQPPDLPGMIHALAKVPGPARKEAILKRAGPIHTIEVNYTAAADGGSAGEATQGELFCQLRGLTPLDASALLNGTCTRSKIPEPIRAAHLIAAGVTRGESGRRA